MVEKITNFFTGSKKPTKQEIELELNSIISSYRELQKTENITKIGKDKCKERAKELLPMLNSDKYKSKIEGSISIFFQTRKSLDTEALNKDFPEINLDKYMKESKTETIRITPKNI